MVSILLLMWILQQPEGFWKFDVGNICVIIGLVAQGVLFMLHSSKQHGENQAKIANILDWKNQHEEDARQRDTAIGELREISSSMQETAKGITQQLQIMRDDIRELRLGRRQYRRPEGETDGTT